MAWIWVTLVYEVVFTVIGIVLMLLPGKVAKFMAIPTFIFILPMVIGKDTVWSISDSGTAQYVSLALPIFYEGIRSYVHSMLAVLGLWNWFDELDRDLFGRKRK